MQRITHRGNLFLYTIEPMTGSLQDQPFPQGTSTETNDCIIVRINSSIQNHFQIHKDTENTSIDIMTRGCILELIMLAPCYNIH